MNSFGKTLIFLFACVVFGYASHDPLPDSIAPLYANYDGLDLMSDAPWVINKDEVIPFFFITKGCKAAALNEYYSFGNSEISYFSTNDTIKRQKTQSDASRVTFGKIALESIGAATGGFLLTYTFFNISLPCVGNFDTWWIVVPFLAPTVGTAGGASLIGNQLTEPNGSFIKSLIGSSIGTLIFAPIAYLSILSGYEGSSMDGFWKPKLSVYVGCAIASLFPISGAVIGYNLENPGCCLIEIDEQQKAEFCFNNLNKIPFRVQILTIKF
jgi:hypothetical protein